MKLSGMKNTFGIELAAAGIPARIFSPSPSRAGCPAVAAGLGRTASLCRRPPVPPWAGCKRAAQVSSSTDYVARKSQLADDRVSPARAGGDGIRDEAGGVAAAGQR